MCIRDSYKGQHLQSDYVSMEQFEANLAAWEAAR